MWYLIKSQFRSEFNSWITRIYQNQYGLDGLYDLTKSYETTKRQSTYLKTDHLDKFDDHLDLFRIQFTIIL